MASIENEFHHWLKNEGAALGNLLGQAEGESPATEYHFINVTPMISLMLKETEATVGATVDGEVWDFLLCEECAPLQTPDGWVCKLCNPSETFSTLSALWRDHLFEPLQTWALTKLVNSNFLLLAKSGGCTYAELRQEITPESAKQDGFKKVWLPLRPECSSE